MNGTIGFLRGSPLDCPNYSAYPSSAELERMKIMYQDLVAKGASIPPSIQAIAKRLGIV